VTFEIEATCKAVVAHIIWHLTDALMRP